MFYAVAALLVAFTVLMGAVPQHAYSLDIFNPLDGAWRIEQGQLPFVNFYTIYGPLVYLVPWLGVWLAGATADAFAIGNGLSCVPVVLFVGWFIVRAQRNITVLLVGLYLVMVWLSPVPLHHFYYGSSYAESYNRHSYVLLMMIFLWMRELDPARRISTLVGVGSLLGLLLFFKVSYFVAGVFLVAGLWAGPKTKERLRDLSWICAGLTVVVALFSGWLGLIGMEEMVRDYAYAAGSRSQGLFVHGGQLLRSEFPILMMIAALGIVEFMQRGGESALVRELKWMGVAFGTGLLAELGGFPETQFPEVPIVSVAFALLMEQMRGLQSVSMMPAWRRYGVPVALLLPMTFSMVNMSLALAFPLTDLPKRSVRLLAPSLVAFQLQDDYDKAAPSLNDGLALVARHPELRNQRFGAICFTDPFLYCLRLRPSEHLPVYFNPGINMSERFHPSADSIFEGCDVIVIPVKKEILAEVLTRMPDYQTYIDEHFHELDRTERWALLVRIKTD